MSPSTMDTATLRRALRGARAIRDRVVVLHLDHTTLEADERLESVAESITILRAADARPVVLVDAGAAGPELTRRLDAAIVRRGERVVPLAAATVVTVHQFAVPTGAVGPDGPVMSTNFMVVFDPTLVGQLAALRYVPIVTLPVVDAAGVVSEVPANDVALAAAKFLDAAVRVTTRADDAPGAPAGDSAARAVVLRPDAVDALLPAVLFEPLAPATGSPASPTEVIP